MMMETVLSSGAADNAVWAQLFDYAVNLEKPNGNEAVLSKYNADGTWSKAGTAKMKVEGNKLMLSVSRELLGISGENTVLDLKFKWADNYTDGDLMSFYTKGDSAPYGRLNWMYGTGK